MVNYSADLAKPKPKPGPGDPDCIMALVQLNGVQISSWLMIVGSCAIQHVYNIYIYIYMYIHMYMY